MSEANEFKKNGLPNGWQWVRLGDLVDEPKQDLVDGPFGSNLKAHEYVNNGIPVFKIQNIKANRFVDKNLNYVTAEKAQILSRHSFKSGDLIITKLGYPLGLCCKVPSKYTYGIIVADLMRLRPSKKKVYDEYLINVINSKVVQNQFKEITKGTTRQRVNLTIVRDIQIPLPSIETQQQIVSKIEELFSELDKSIEQLKTAQEQLKVYRQNVLKWAFEGKLTNENVKDGELANGWKVKSLIDVCEKIQDGSHFSPKNQYYEKADNRFLYITAKNIRTNYMDLSNVVYVDKEFHESIFQRCNPEYGDVLLTKDGVNTGDVTLNILKEPFSLLSSVCLLKTKREHLIPTFLKYYIQSPIGNKNIIGEMTGTAIKRIILKRIKEAEIIIPPIKEQELIVQETEDRLSVADKLEETITNSLQQAETLRQSILKKAFEGRLNY